MIGSLQHKIFGMKRPKNTISSIEPVANDSPYVEKSMLARNLNIVEWTKLVSSEQLRLPMLYKDSEVNLGMTKRAKLFVAFDKANSHWAAISMILSLQRPETTLRQSLYCVCNFRHKTRNHSRAGQLLLLQIEVVVLM